MKTTSKNIMQHKKIASKNNDCGTAPGNLVSYNYQEWDMNQTGAISLEQMTEIYRIYKVKQR